jgi:predicted NUDIX family NTP pyrophosphohydrolase
MSEDPEQAARREFAEELGPAASIDPLQALGEIRQRGGKRVIAFWGEADFDTASLFSNTFEIGWPPRSGRLQAFAEVDCAEWFDFEAARSRILSGQIELIDRLSECSGPNHAPASRARMPERERPLAGCSAGSCRSIPHQWSRTRRRCSPPPALLPKDVDATKGPSGRVDHGGLAVLGH